jgi:hypothetical protein
VTRFGWYRPWMADALDSSLSTKAKALSAVLAKSEWGGVVQSTATKLGIQASLHPRSVRRALTELSDAGFIDLRHRTDGHHITGFVITLLERDDKPLDTESTPLDTESRPPAHDVKTPQTQSPEPLDTESDIPAFPSSSLSASGSAAPSETYTPQTPQQAGGPDPDAVAIANGDGPSVVDDWEIKSTFRELCPDATRRQIQHLVKEWNGPVQPVAMALFAAERLDQDSEAIAA